MRAANNAGERSGCSFADLDLIERASASCSSFEKGEKAHLGVAKKVAELLEELLHDLIVEEEEVVEVEHCRDTEKSAILSRDSNEEGKLTLQRQENVEAGAPARRVAQKVDELAHKRTSELDGELKASTGDEYSSGRAAKLLRGERRGGSATGLALQGSEATYIVVEDLLHAEELGEKLGDEGEGRADAEVGNARPDPGED